MNLNNDKVIGENEKAIFYTNLMCKEYDDGYRIVAAELKSNNYKSYLLIKNNHTIYENQAIDAIGSRLEAHRRIDLEDK